MKIRESGMPPKEYWDQFFNPERLFRAFLQDQVLDGDGVEFGCGYGTFSFAALQHLSGQLHALDIEPDLVHQLKHQAIRQNQPRLKPKVVDFVSYGTQLPDASQTLALIFNLLHLENPTALLSEAFRILKPKGLVVLIHWRTDIPTPRGPSMAIRPTPQQCETWLQQVGFETIRHIDIHQACPYHYGIGANKPPQNASHASLD